jgi:hypothetical protein
MTPIETPAIPGTAIEPADSMDERMYASVPRARLSMGTGASPCIAATGPDVDMPPL